MPRFSAAVKNDSIDVAHVSSVHRWTDNRVYLREAVSTSTAYRTVLFAVDSPTRAPASDVDVTLLPRRRRPFRILVTGPQAVWLALRSRAGVIHLHDPELVWSIPVLRALGRRVVFDAHEDIPDQVRDKGYLPRPLREVSARLSHVVVALARSADHVIAATETVALRYPAEKRTVVRNYPHLREEETVSRGLLDRPQRAAYVGVVSRLRGSVDMVLASAEPFFPQGWTIDVAGSFYPEHHGVELRELAGPNSQIHGLLSPETARDLLLESRVGLVVLHPTPAYRQALATKMFEYLAAGLPVIASDFPVWRDVLAGYDCATFVDPEDPAAIAAAIAFYENNPAVLVRHGATARRAALERFNWRREEAALLGVYASLGLPARP